MTMTDSLPPTVAGPANDDTETVLAWSQDTDLDGGRESWGWAFSYAGAVVVIGVVVAVIIGVLGGILLQPVLPPPHAAAPHTVPVVAPPMNPAPPPVPAPPVWKTAQPAPTVTRTQSPPMAPPPSPSRAELDNRYLSELTAGGLQITDVPAVLLSAREVCQYLAAGHTEADTVALALHNNALLTVGNARTMVDAAIDVYCPSYG